MKTSLRPGGSTGPSSIRSRTKTCVLGCSLLLSALLLAECSSGSSPKTFSTVSLKPGTIVPFDLSHNARSDVHVSSCRMSKGTWQADGTVKNPSSGTLGFQIVVDFVTSKGDTVLSTTEVIVSNVSGDSSVDWSATGAKGKNGVACLVRQAETTT
jgi:hypothetical protein